jgi:translation initiation factor 1
MSNKNKNLRGVVYSTNPDYGFDKNDKQEQSTLTAKQQNLRTRIEKNHRGGKTVTVIDGFIGKTEDLESLARILKTKCGVGGSVKDGLILIQGEQKEKVVRILNEMGYKAK